jgi:hypothetical protein
MGESMSTKQWRRVLSTAAEDADAAREALALHVSAARADGLSLREIGSAISKSYQTAKRLSEAAR